MSRSFHAILLGAAAAASLALPLPARADARQDLRAAYVKMMALTTFKAKVLDLQTGKKVMTVEYQAPGRYRATKRGEPPVIIANGEMVGTIDEVEQHFPLPKGPGMVPNGDLLEALERGAMIEGLGSAQVQGKVVRIYRQTSLIEGRSLETVIWVDEVTGLTVRVESRGSTMGALRWTFSDFNNPNIRIGVPN